MADKKHRKLVKGTPEWNEYQKRAQAALRDHPSVSAVDDHLAVERERRRVAAKEFLERERSREQGITPMEALAENAENGGRTRLAAGIRALQRMEQTFGGRAGRAPAKSPRVGVGTTHVVGKFLSRAKSGGTPGTKTKPAVTPGTKPAGTPGTRPSAGVDPMEFLPDLLGQDRSGAGTPPPPDAYPFFYSRPSSSWTPQEKQKFADYLARNSAVAGDVEAYLKDPRFNRFFFGDDPAATMREVQKYGEMRALLNEVLEPNEILGAGSAGISTEGTIFRKSAVPHDLDFSGYIDNASRRPDWTTAEAQAASTAALMNNANIENAPIIRKLRQLYPELRDAKFRYATRDWEWSSSSPYGSQYQEGVFTVPLTGVNRSESGRTSRLVTTMIKGNKVDLMLSDHLLEASKADPRFGSAAAAIDWKRGYADGNTLSKRWMTKDGPDEMLFKPYGPDNPVIDTELGRTQYNPFAFADTLVDKRGFPRIHQVETFPGSGKFVPAFMNTEGRLLPILPSRKFKSGNLSQVPSVVLDYYSGKHPINDVQLANSRATRDNKPLVAIRGVSPLARENGRTSEIGPSIGIYPGHNLDVLADEIMKGSGWAHKFNDVVVYGREDVDPQFDIRNMLYDQDAYTTYIPSNLRQLAGTPAGNAAAHMYAALSDVPDFNSYPSIGNAYRNQIYRNNPGGHIDSKYLPTYYGYGEAKPYRDLGGRVVITADERSKDPAGARKKLLDALYKYRFMAPLAGAAGLAADGDQQPDQEDDVHQAARGGDAGGQPGSTAPTEEQVAEALEFLHTVLEIGAPQNEWEQSMVQRMINELEKRRPSGAARPEPPEGGSVTADAGGGTADEDRFAEKAARDAARETRANDNGRLDERAARYAGGSARDAAREARANDNGRLDDRTGRYAGKDARDAAREARANDNGRLDERTERFSDYADYLSGRDRQQAADGRYRDAAGNYSKPDVLPGPGLVQQAGDDRSLKADAAGHAVLDNGAQAQFAAKLPQGWQYSPDGTPVVEKGSRPTGSRPRSAPLLPVGYRYDPSGMVVKM